MGLIAKVEFCETIADVCLKPHGKIKFVLDKLGMLDEVEKYTEREKRDLFAAIDNILRSISLTVGCPDEYLAFNCGPLNTIVLNGGCTKKLLHREDCEKAVFRDYPTYMISDGLGNFSTTITSKAAFVDTARAYKMMYDRYARVGFIDNTITDMFYNREDDVLFDDALSVYYDILVRYSKCSGGLNKYEINSETLNDNECVSEFSELAVFLDDIDVQSTPYPIPPEDMPNDIIALVDDIILAGEKLKGTTIAFFDHYIKEFYTSTSSVVFFDSPDLTIDDVEFNYIYQKPAELSEAIFIDEFSLDFAIVNESTKVGFVDTVYTRVLTARALNKSYLNRKELN